MKRITVAVGISVAAVSLSIPARTVPPPRPKITGIDCVRIYVSDLDASRKFYGQSLGLHDQTASCVNASNACFSINAEQEITLLLAPSEPAPTDLIAQIVFATDDADYMRRYLRASGPTPDPLSKDKNSIHFDLRDREDKRIGFISRRHSSPWKPDGNQVGTRLIHAGFVVHNRLKQNLLYKDLLGFRVYWHGGMKEGDDNWVDMQVPDGTDWIEYMLKVPENATHKQLGVMNHIALGVPDIQAAKEQLIKNGWKGTEEPKIGRDGKWQLNLYDPDETRVELMEFKPTNEPCCSAYTGPHPGPPQ